MKKNILIINSKKIDNYLSWLFSKLKNDYSLSWFLNNKKFFKLFILGPQIKNNFSFLLFFIFLPIFLILNFFILLIKIKKEKIKTIICINYNEKIIFSILNKLFKINIIWVENIKENEIKKLKKFLSKKIKIICFLQNNKKLLEKKLKTNSIYFLPISTKTKEKNKQENIFNNLANNQYNKNKKYFTIGTIIDNQKSKYIETLFHSIKLCLDFIPNLQFIILSKQENKKQITWLIKNTGITNISWFIAQEDACDTKKWFENFDLFVSTYKKINIKNIQTLLTIIFNKTPVISFFNKNLEEIIIDNKNGFLLQKNNKTLLLKTITDLYKNKLKIYKLGEQGKSFVLNKHQIDNCLNIFKKIL